MRSGHALGADHDSLEPAPQQPVLREAFGVHEPGVHRVHVIREAEAPLATEREKASCACFEAEYGPTATVPATETTFTRCDGAAASSAGRNASRHQTDPR